MPDFDRLAPAAAEGVRLFVGVAIEAMSINRRLQFQRIHTKKMIVSIFRWFPLRRLLGGFRNEIFKIRFCGTLLTKTTGFIMTLQDLRFALLAFCPGKEIVKNIIIF